jgi:hypothetical protein
MEQLQSILTDLDNKAITKHQAYDLILVLFDVSRRSEQLCQHSWVKHPSHPKIGAMVCLKCGSELA